MVIDFFMVMKKVPTVTHQEKQVHVVNGKPVFYEPDELKAARAKLQAHLGQHIPEEKFTGPVSQTQTIW
jgi:Holliday junction resolvase RusA-like endonuclease